MQKQFSKRYASVVRVAASVTTLVAILGAGVKWN